jgi:hypothetical protein
MENIMNVVQILQVWLASIVLTLFPPVNVHPNNIDAQQEYVIHVNEVVKDIYDIVYDPSYAPWFSGNRARAHDAALATIVAAQESGGFDPLVESGVKRGDKGASWCLMAMNIGRGKTLEGWTGPELIADRKKCLLSGIKAIKRSMNACRGYGMLSGLSAYDTGHCIKDESISVRRVSRAVWLVNRKVPTDVQIFAEINNNSETVKIADNL